MIARPGGSPQALPGFIQAKIPAGKHIGVATSAHGDYRDGPWPHPRQLAQAAQVQFVFTAVKLLAQVTQGVASPPWHREVVVR